MTQQTSRSSCSTTFSIRSASSPGSITAACRVFGQPTTKQLTCRGPTASSCSSMASLIGRILLRRDGQIEVLALELFGQRIAEPALGTRSAAFRVLADRRGFAGCCCPALLRKQATGGIRTIPGMLITLEKIAVVQPVVLGPCGVAVRFLLDVREHAVDLRIQIIEEVED